MDPFVRELARRQQQESEEESSDNREVAVRRLGAQPGLEVVDLIVSPTATTFRVAAEKAQRLGLIARAAERARASGRMPTRLSR